MKTQCGDSIRVLIADDDAAIRFVLNKTLSHEGFAVAEATTGNEAIDAFKAGELYGGQAFLESWLPELERAELEGREGAA